MENFDLLSNDLQVSPHAQGYLTESAKWGKFLAIIGFIFCGFMLLLAFFIPFMFSQLPQNTTVQIAFTVAMRTGLTIVYSLLAVILFFPALYLYKFSVKMQLATREMSQENFDESLKNLKSVFKFYGIFTIIILSFYVIIFIISIAAVAMR